ncbi:MAG: type II toxin-antitoxin system HicA family toxin [Planctomycetes bacterium]|nr:type II toxin-antitoxin system HicA family toxin [Planctomycetota bacterium]
MAPWVPCKRLAFARRLRRLNFQGPFRGKRHEFMVYGQHRLAIPSNKEYSIPQLRMMLREVEGIIGRAILPEEWSRL